MQAVLRRSRLVSFALSCIMRASDPAHVPAHPLSSERLHLLCENAPNLPLSKAQKARSPIIFCQKGFPMSFFLAARRFGGTAFCRRQEIRPPFLRILSRDPDIDPCAPSQTAEFAVISGFAVRIISFPVYDRVSKNTRRFRALSAFEKSSLTSAHIRRPFLAALALLTPKL